MEKAGQGRHPVHQHPPLPVQQKHGGKRLLLLLVQHAEKEGNVSALGGQHEEGRRRLAPSARPGLVGHDGVSGDGHHPEAETYEL